MPYTADQLALKAFLEARKEETLAWVAEDPENRWAGYATTDIDHWIERDINSIQDFELDSMRGSFWDLYKDVNGFRPRHIDVYNMSYDELSPMYDRLLQELEEQQIEEKAREARAVEEFETKIAELICMGAMDRENAIRWLREAEQDEDSMYDDGYFEYDYGLPYGYIKLGKADPLYN